MEPVTLELKESHSKLCIEQTGVDTYQCTLFQFSPETKTFTQVNGANGQKELLIEMINTPSSFKEIVNWAGIQWSVPLFNIQHLLENKL